MPSKPVVTIEYCPKCSWMLRAAYLAQELLTTSSDELYGVTLRPSEVSGRYTLSVNDAVVFDRKAHGGFAKIKDIKQRARNVVSPGKGLGHSDNKPA